VLSRIVLVSLAALAALAVTGCADGGRDPGRRSVVAAFYPLAWAAKQVGGDGVVVTDLTPAGAEPHDLELTPRDVQAARDADLVLYLGGFQPALDDALEEAHGKSVDLLAGRSAATAAGVDPHVWLDPRAYAGLARQIAIAIGPGASADGLVARLHGLDRAFARGLARCARRELVTSHAAFGHLARRYGLEQVPLSGLEPEAEPSPRDLERLVERVRATGATTVFVEPLVSPKLAETIAREAGVRTAVLNPLEGLTGDQLEAGEDYVTVMEANLAALRRALGCA
jgi:zinc transport system substrate-binding protein